MKPPFLYGDILKSQLFCSNCLNYISLIVSLRLKFRSTIDLTSIIHLIFLSHCNDAL